ncbi:MAG: mitochondrial fission ELM1 family protein [Alphaproteobacteria bacterium]
MSFQPPKLPQVWTLTTDKAGDRGQIIALAAALGWPAKERRLVFNPLYRKSNLLLGAGLKSLDVEASDPLDPPWPDLVIASGRRSVPVARWIRRQSRGRTRLVHIGRPWAPSRWFDLIVTTAQYRLPAGPNVLTNALTLNRPDKTALAAAADRWRARWAALDRPLIAVLVGGNAKPLVFTETAARELGERATALAEALGGSLAVTTSRRSPDAAVDALFASLPADSFRHRFGRDTDNPYLGLLALADQFIVTGDSASMLSEACGSGQPVHLFPLPRRLTKKRKKTERWRRFCLGVDGRGRGPLAWLYHLLVHLNRIKAARDMSAFNRTLIENGLVRLLDGSEGDLSTPPATRRPPVDGLALAVARVRALFPEADDGQAHAEHDLEVASEAMVRTS